MTRALGIDADSHRLAWAVAGADGVVYDWGTIPRANSRGVVDRAYDHAVTRLARRAQEMGYRVVVEDTFLATGRTTANVAALKRLCYVAGELQRAFRQHGVPLEFITANEWRAAVLGTLGRRDAMKAAAFDHCRRLGVDVANEHEADAACIALAAAMRLEAPEHLDVAR